MTTDKEAVNNYANRPRDDDFCFESWTSFRNAGTSDLVNGSLSPIVIEHAISMNSKGTTIIIANPTIVAARLDKSKVSLL